METLGTTKADDDDPLIKAASGIQKSGKHVSFDDELGGLSGESQVLKCRIHAFELLWR